MFLEKQTHCNFIKNFFSDHQSNHNRKHDVEHHQLEPRKGTYSNFFIVGMALDLPFSDDRLEQFLFKRGQTLLKSECRHKAIPMHNLQLHRHGLSNFKPSLKETEYSIIV